MLVAAIIGVFLVGAIVVFILISREPIHKDFYSAERVREHLDLLDGLRDEALSRVFADEEEMARSIANHARRKSSAGIKFIYTIFKHDAGYIHHLSMSGDPFLPSGYAKFLYGLSANRLGIPIPSTIFASPQAVYHGEWVLSEPEHSEVVSAVTVDARQSEEALASELIVKTASIDVQKIPWPKVC